MNKKIAWLNDIYIAHRGLHNISKGIPENSLLAFDGAIKSNVAIELDVHILKDKKIIVFHDDNLNRCCGIDKDIKNCCFKDIHELTLLNTNHKIPLLEDVLRYVDSAVPIIIEVKTDVSHRIICPELAKLLKGYKGPYAIKSFNPLIVNWFKRNYNSIPRGMLVSDFKNEKRFTFIKKLLLTSMVFLPLCKPDFISVKLSLLKSKKVKRIKNKNNITVIGWTFKTKLDIINYESYCDGYIFENIEV